MYSFSGSNCDNWMLCESLAIMHRVCGGQPPAYSSTVTADSHSLLPKNYPRNERTAKTNNS